MKKMMIGKHYLIEDEASVMLCSDISYDDWDECKRLYFRVAKKICTISMYRAV